MGTGELLGKTLTNCWGVTCDGLASRPGGVEILLAASCYGNRDKLRPDEPVGSKGFTSLPSLYPPLHTYFIATPYKGFQLQDCITIILN